MTNRHRPFRPLIVDGEFIVCPFCGRALQERVLHSCPDLRADSEPPARRFSEWFLGWPQRWLVGAFIVFVLAYFGAHVLVSLGVGCPGAN